MADISELMRACCDKSSSEYKQGWQDAVCFINDFHKITERASGETMDFVFEVNIDEDEFVKKLTQQMEGKL